LAPLSRRCLQLLCICLELTLWYFAQTSIVNRAVSKQAHSPHSLHLTACEPARERSGVIARPTLPCEDAVQQLFSRCAAAAAAHHVVR
jgi:hypothetical protein